MQTATTVIKCWFQMSPTHFNSRCTERNLLCGINKTASILVRSKLKYVLWVFKITGHLKHSSVQQLNYLLSAAKEQLYAGCIATELEAAPTVTCELLPFTGETEHWSGYNWTSFLLCSRTPPPLLFSHITTLSHVSSLTVCYTTDFTLKINMKKFCVLNYDLFCSAKNILWWWWILLKFVKPLENEPNS